MTQSSGMVPANPAGLEREVDNLRQRFETLQRQQSAARATTLLATLVIIVLFACFGWALFRAGRANLAQEEMREAFVKEAEVIRPDVERHLQSALDVAWPRYRAEGEKRLREVGPEVAAAFRDEFQDLPTEAGQEMTSQLQETLQRVVAKVEPDLRKRFPSLTEERIARMLEEFRDKHVADQTERLRQKLDTAAVTEGAEVMHILQKFNAPSSEGRDGDQLKRDLVIAMLDYAKYQVEFGGTDDPQPQQLFPAMHSVGNPPAETPAAK